MSFINIMNKSVCLLLILPFSVMGSELSTLIKIALDKNYEIRNSEYEIISSKYDKKIELAPLHPTINIKAGTNWNEGTTKYLNGDPSENNKYNSNDYSISLSQTLLDYSKVYSYDESKLELEINVIKHQKIINDIIIKVVENYFSYLKFQAQQKATKAELNSSITRYKQIKRNNELGNLSKTDVYEAFAQKEGNVRAIDNIKKDILISLRQLNSTTQTNIKPKFDIKLNLNYKEISPKKSQELKDALYHKNYDIRVSKEEIKKTKLQLSGSKSNFLPTISASVSYNYTDSNNALPTHKNDTSFGLQLNVPIASGGSDFYAYKKNQNKLEQSQVNYEQSINDTLVSYDELVAEINNNVSSINLLKSIILANYSVYNGTQKAYVIGTKTLTDLLASESSLYNSIRDYYSNNYDYIINMTKLNAMLGPIDLTVLNTLSESMVPLAYDFDITVLDKLRKDLNE